MFFRKIHILYTEYKQTSVKEGSPVLFFFCFWLTKLFSPLQRINPFVDNIIHKIVRQLPHHKFIIKNMSGIFAVQAFDDSTVICSSYFEKEIRHWLDRTMNKDIFIDIGANRGIYTIIASSQYNFKKIHAFEPNTEVFSILKKNVALNHQEAITELHQVAVGRDISRHTLMVDPLHKGGGKIISKKSGPNDEILSIKVVPLDSQFKPSEITRIGFIKIDTEGYEKEVLFGMNNILTNMPRDSFLMIETNDLEAIKAFLKKYHFKWCESSNDDHLFSKM